MKEIKKVTDKIYFICWDDEKVRRLQGLVVPSQTLSTPWTVTTYKTKSRWKRELLNSGMTESEFNTMQEDEEIN